jgi:hypothetical protein
MDNPDYGSIDFSPPEDAPSGTLVSSEPLMNPTMNNSCGKDDRLHWLSRGGSVTRVDQT